MRPTTRVFFAGEATIREEYSTAPGAFYSGCREARNVVKWWNHFCEKLRNQPNLFDQEPGEGEGVRGYDREAGGGESRCRGV